MIKNMVRTRNVIYTLEQEDGITVLKVFSTETVEKPIYSKKIPGPELLAAEEFLKRIKTNYNQYTGKKIKGVKA